MYKILINESSVPVLIEVPEKPKEARPYSPHVMFRDELRKWRKYDEALSAALADESKHIQFKDHDSVTEKLTFLDSVDFKFTNKEWLKNRIGQTFDLPPNIGVSFEYQLKDGGGWKDITHRHYLNSFPEHRRVLAILTPITMKEEPIDCNTASNEEARRDFSSIVKHIDAPVKSEGEEQPKHKRGMEVLKIYAFQAQLIEDALRLAARTLESKNKETSMDRDIMQAYQMIKNIQEGKIDEHVPQI